MGILKPLRFPVLIPDDENIMGRYRKERTIQIAPFPILDNFIRNLDNLHFQFIGILIIEHDDILGQHRLSRYNRPGRTKQPQ